MKKIVFAGPVQTISGYGSRSRDFVLSLIDLGHDVSIISAPWGDTPKNALDLSNPRHKLIHERIIPNLISKPDIWIQCTIPNEFQPVGNYNIGLTAGIETTVCRPEWIEGCNKMDLVLVSSTHSKNVFETASFEKRDNNTQQVIEILKLNTPIDVLFEGVDINIFKRQSCKSELINKFMNQIPEDFCFLFVGHWLQGDLGHDRKDIGMLVQTFHNLFKRKAPQNRPALILKTSHASFSNLELLSIKDKLNIIAQSVIDQGGVTSLPNVYLLHGELTDEEMAGLYNHDKVKAMISFTKGEGFGRPLLEFTTTGKPVIASAWSGQLDFLNPEFSYLLPGQVNQVHPSAVNNWIMQEGGWFTVNYTYAAQIIDSCYKLYEKFLDKSKKHINITKNSFSFDIMKDRIQNVLDNLESYKDVKDTNQPVMTEFKIPTKVNEIV